MLTHHYRCLLDVVLPFRLEDIEEQETIHSGQYENLKFDDGQIRVWQSRMTVADGMPYDNEITVEVLDDGCWVTKHSFPLEED